MPEFRRTDPDDDDHEHKPAQDEVRAINNLPPLPPPPILAANNPATNSAVPPPVFTPTASAFGGGFGAQQAAAQVNPAVGFAQAEIDAEVANHQMQKKSEHWVKSYWRPAMGWLYMAMCMFDFIIFPMTTIILPIVEAGLGVHMPYNEWKSLTLSNGGLIHISFGAILGVTAFTRSQEKMAGKN